MSEVERIIAAGGTAGLIAFLFVAVVALASFARAAYNDMKQDRDDWKLLANGATKGFEDATDTNKRLTEAIEARNRIEEEQLREARREARSRTR